MERKASLASVPCEVLRHIFEFATNDLYEAARLLRVSPAWARPLGSLDQLMLRGPNAMKCLEDADLVSIVRDFPLLKHIAPVTGGYGITDVGVRLISRTLHKLEHLELHQCDLTDDGVGSLAWLPSLTTSTSITVNLQTDASLSWPYRSLACSM
jgi:hypothetical protein